MSLSFGFQLGTSLPFDELEEYLLLTEAITSKRMFLQHLLHYEAELFTIQIQEDAYCIIFSLKKPFTHRLTIFFPESHPENLLSIVELIHGTVYEMRGMQLLCEAKVLRSELAYWTWKSQQEEFYKSTTLDDKLFSKKYVYYDLSDI